MNESRIGPRNPRSPDVVMGDPHGALKSKSTWRRKMTMASTKTGSTVASRVGYLSGDSVVKMYRGQGLT